MPVKSTASSSQASPSDSAPPPCQPAKASTSPQPASAQAQKPAEGRWRSTSAPMTAVDSGISPVTTAACMASTCRSASARLIGKPTTVPTALTASAGQCRVCGQGARTANRYSTLKSPASAARPAVTKAGDSCGSMAPPTASRVMGRVMAKMTTPSRPKAKPWVTLRGLFGLSMTSALSREIAFGPSCSTRALPDPRSALSLCDTNSTEAIHFAEQMTRLYRQCPPHSQLLP